MNRCEHNSVGFGGRSLFALLTALVVLASGLVFAPQASAQNDEAEAEEEAEAEGLDVACVEPPSGMTAWWGFERDGKGKRVPDLSGNQPVGKMKKKAKRVSGPVGAAVQFDGKAANVQVRKPDLQLGEGDFSVDFWIKTTDTDRMPDVIFDNRRNKKSGFNVYTWRGRPGIQLNGESHTAKSFVKIADGEWHFVAFSINTTGGIGKIYVDGVHRDSFNFRRLGQSFDGPRVVLGKKFKLGGNEPLTGSLDEFEVFNRQLTDEEVKGIYDAGPAGKCRVTVEDTKELLQERLLEVYGEQAEVICDCVLESLLDAYEGDLNRLFKDLDKFGRRIQLLLNRIIPGCEPCAAPPPGMIGWYPFDVAGEEISGGGLPGITPSGATMAPGLVDGAATFDGVDDRFSAPGTERFNQSEGDFAIDFWMKTTDDRLGAIAMFDNRTDDFSAGFHVYTWRDQIGLQINGSNYGVATDGFRDGEWHLVAISYSFGPSQASYYLDGELVGTRTVSLRPESIDGGPMIIGNSDLSGNGAYAGQLDELELFNTQLSAASVKEIFDAGSNGKCKPVAVG